MRKIRNILLLINLFVLIGSIPFATVLTGTKASAFSGADFKPGRIIDDAVFFDGNAMNTSQIQNFLIAKFEDRNCAPGHTCLKDYVVASTPQKTPESGLCGHMSAKTNQTAAQIINDVGKACGISPKVILVLLQKETGLLTRTAPGSYYYHRATGYWCPDSDLPLAVDANQDGCYDQYEGFFNQIFYAARIYKWYALNDGPNYRKNQNNYIQYHPNPACGGSTVYIENQATAGLYNYTPYQPNAATLAVGLGVEAHCGAYGNKNFWWLFNSWFGSTYAPNYAWNLSSQQIFADSNRTAPISWGILSPGKTYYIRVKAKNTGNRTWERGGSNPVLLGTKGDANSQLCDNSWITCKRAALLQEASIEPGETGTFEFSVKAPSDIRTFNQYFNLLSEGNTWMDDIGMHISLRTRATTHEWSFVEQGVYSDMARTVKLNSKVLNPNTTYYMRLRVRNIGNTTWHNSGSNPIRLGTSVPIDRTSTFCDDSWVTCNRASTTNESSVTPGTVGTFDFTIRTSSAYGNFNEYFRPVIEGSAWLRDIGMHWPLGVKQPTYTWKFSGQTAHTDETKSATANLSSVRGGTRVFLTLRAQNTGNATWSNSGPNQVRIGTTNSIDRNSPVCDDSWIACNRPARLKEATVAPGETGTFEFWADVPYSINNTVYREYFRPVAEGVAWMNDLGQHWKFTMDSPLHTWQYQGQGIFSDQNRTVAVNPASLSRNTTYYLRLRAKNIGGNNWSRSSTKLGTSNPVDRASSLRDSSWPNSNRAALLKESNVAPGETGTFEFSITTPDSAGSFNEHFRPVIEGVAWMNDLGQHWNLTVN